MGSTRPRQALPSKVGGGGSGGAEADTGQSWKPVFSKDGVADAAEVTALERATHTLAHGEGRCRVLPAL